MGDRWNRAVSVVAALLVVAVAVVGWRQHVEAQHDRECTRAAAVLVRADATELPELDLDGYRDCLDE